MANCIRIMSAACVFGKDQYIAITITNDTGIDSSTVACGAIAEVPGSAYQLWHTVLVCGVGVY